MTKIQWTESTWNPTTGCDQVSPGCDNCYALGQAKRLKRMGQAKYQTDGSPLTSGPGFGLAVHEDTLTAPLHWRAPRRVFVNSMSDLFHARVPDGFIARVFAVMAATPQHSYQILTKRHGRMRSLLGAPWFPELVTTWAWRDGVPPRTPMVELPAPNVWLGVSAEDQKWADIRIPALMQTPAAVRFVSAEPLLGPVRLAPDDHTGHDRDHQGTHTECLDCSTPEQPVAWTTQEAPPLDWVIIGGESGSRARPMNLDWARDLANDARQAGAAVFVKQLGSVWEKSANPIARDRKGGNPLMWPEDLQVREWPESGRAV